MPDTIRCPDCGHENPAGSTSCEHCNFPFQGPAPASTPGSEPPIVIQRPIRRQRPRPGPAVNPTSMSLWLFFGVVMAAALLWTAFTSFRKNNAPPVEGANVAQQREADSLRSVLERDSTNVGANVEYGNLLYDTGNWPEAVVHYGRALERDSSLTNVMVDLGVCYFNMSRPDRAAELFQLALRREPDKPQALYGMGMVRETAGDVDGALGFYHRAMELAPSQEMKDAVLKQMQQLIQKSGRKAPPLAPGTGGMPPGGAAPVQPPPGAGK